jgi:predicted transposase YdaD
MQPDIARDIMEIHLPAELRSVCDLSTLKRESGSFVEDALMLIAQQLEQKGIEKGRAEGLH